MNERAGWIRCWAGAISEAMRSLVARCPNARVSAYALPEHAIHNKEWKAAQQNALRVINVRSVGLRPLRNQLDSPIELATKPFDDTTIGGTIPHCFIASIDSGIRDAMARGVLSGHLIVDLRVELYDGAYHDTDSTDAAFKAAAAMAFLDAAKKAQPMVLEPVMQVVVAVDDRHVKAVLNDLLARRGEVQTITHEADRQAVVARVPLSELFGFEGKLRTHFHARASCSIEFAGYQPVVQGPGGDDERTSRVRVPRRPAPNLRTTAAAVPEPDG